MTERRDGHDCWSCGTLFVLAYSTLDGEGLEAAPINCPECGSLNYLPVARRAAATHAYKAEEIRR